MDKKPKPLFISTPSGDKSPFDDFWKIKRSELEALKKKYRELRNCEYVPRSDALNAERRETFKTKEKAK